MLKGNGKYDLDARESKVVGRTDTSIRLTKESKRKLSPLRIVEKAQLINAIQNISK